MYNKTNNNSDKNSYESLTYEGYDIRMHVHDEVIIDCPENSITPEAACFLMSGPISWAEGLPLKAAGFESKYYMKD